MIKPEFTPGPWRVDLAFTLTDARPYGITSNEGAMIIRWGGICKKASSEGRANAKLIAAAPTMYLALQEIIDMNVQYAVDRYGDASKAEDMACVRVARAALAKARGET